MALQSLKVLNWFPFLFYFWLFNVFHSRGIKKQNFYKRLVSRDREGELHGFHKTKMRIILATTKKRSIWNGVLVKSVQIRTLLLPMSLPLSLRWNVDDEQHILNICFNRWTIFCLFVYLFGCCLLLLWQQQHGISTVVVLTINICKVLKFTLNYGS